MKKFEQKNSIIITAVSALVGLATVTSIVALVLNRVLISRQHKKKWKDYDECGVF